MTTEIFHRDFLTELADEMAAINDEREITQWAERLRAKAGNP